MTTGWTRVLDAGELSSDKPRTIRSHGKQIVLFRLGDEEIHAIDNRCPHEGYPLSTGMLSNGVLTCEWHNWKFRLCSGECILGGEDVRRYPLRVDDGGIWLDLADPPLEQLLEPLYRSLEGAIYEGDLGQAGRTVERLLQAGETAERVLAVVCEWGATHAPYGFDHGLAAAADLAAMLGDFADEPVVPIMEALSLIVEPNLRRPARPIAPPQALGGALDEPGHNGHKGQNDQDRPEGHAPAQLDLAALEVELRRSIEVEDVAGAEALVRGALDAGLGADVLAPWLLHAVTDHFSDFAHSHIYCIKAFELLEAIGWQHAHPILTSVVTQMVYATREDRLPYMRDYGRQVAPHLERLSEWAATLADPHARLGLDELVAAVLDGSLSQALGAVAAALDRRVAPQRIALGLGIAAAHRLLRFDARLEHDDSVSEGWLDITHTLTHADAVHAGLGRDQGADSLRGLFYSARFIQHLQPCDLPAAERPVIPAAPVIPAGPQAAAPALAAAVRAHDEAGAMAAMRAGLAAGDPAIGAALRRLAVSDRVTGPIFVVHHIKVAMAALRLTGVAAADPELGSHPGRDLPALAAARFLAHPLRERRVAHNARVSRTFVREGKKHKSLLGY